jgi:hypothetical protein
MSDLKGWRESEKLSNFLLNRKARKKVVFKEKSCYRKNNTGAKFYCVVFPIAALFMDFFFIKKHETRRGLTKER